jgi:hypothetical protein
LLLLVYLQKANQFLLRPGNTNNSRNSRSEGFSVYQDNQTISQNNNVENIDTQNSSFLSGILDI